MANIKRPPPSAAILKGEVLSVICVLFMFLIDYVKILQLVAICAIIFVTDRRTRRGSRSSYFEL